MTVVLLGHSFVRRLRDDLLHQQPGTKGPDINPYHSPPDKALKLARNLNITHHFHKAYVAAQSSHNLQLSQLRTDSKLRRDNVTLHFTSYKHSSSQITPLVVHATHRSPCPIRAYKRYLQLRGHAPGPAFIHPDGMPVTRQQLSGRLRHFLALADLKADLYDTHSFRIGKATDIAREGYTDAQIALIGRWKSDAFRRYIKPSLIHSSLR